MYRSRRGRAEGPVTALGSLPLQLDGDAVREPYWAGRSSRTIYVWRRLPDPPASAR